MDGIFIDQLLPPLRSHLEPVEQEKQLAALLEKQRAGTRRSAVLISLLEHAGEINVALIRRATTLRWHSGEIAFPGGSFDSSDASLIETALREAEEEVGLPPSEVEVLGLLQPVFTTTSNFLIMPVVAYLSHGLWQVKQQKSEVDELVLLPLRILFTTPLSQQEIKNPDGTIRFMHVYDCGPYHIIGATARLLSALLTAIQA
jgi:8-oxo-dGTP pyrophosphatase MutT (NUDIX family)